MRIKNMSINDACRVAAASLAIFAAACGGGRAQPAAGAHSVETRPTEATGQTPAFTGQTRINEERLGVAYRVETLAEGLDHPWSLAFLPDSRML